VKTLLSFVANATMSCPGRKRRGPAFAAICGSPVLFRPCHFAREKPVDSGAVGRVCLAKLSEDLTHG